MHSHKHTYIDTRMFIVCGCHRHTLSPTHVPPAAPMQHTTTHCKAGAEPFVDEELQHTATTCNTLQHTTTQELHPLWMRTCNTLQRPTAHYITLQYTTAHFNTLQNTATLEHTATHYKTLQHTTTYCNTLQHTATHCNTHTPSSANRCSEFSNSTCSSSSTKGAAPALQCVVAYCSVF